MFSIGDKVVCVDDAFDVETASYFSPLPRRGLVYCVRAVGSDVVLGRLVIWVCGITGRLYIGGRERPLRASRFRKIEAGNVGQIEEIEKYAHAAQSLEPTAASRSLSIGTVAEYLLGHSTTYEAIDF